MKYIVTPAKSGLRGHLTMPPDKSIAHRSALFALLHTGKSVIKNYSQAADPQTSLKAISKLGARVEQQEDGTVTIYGVGRDGIPKTCENIDCENSGTTIRLISGIIAGGSVKTSLSGDASLNKRPMRRIIQPLAMMGAEISAVEETYPPLTFSGASPLNAIDYTLPIASAQIKSCILLAGLFTNKGTIVRETIPSRDHTERMLGLSKKNEGNQIVISSSRSHFIPAQKLTIPGDFSAAAFWITAALIVPESDLILENVGLNPSRIAFLNSVREMGAEIEIEMLQNEPEPVGRLRVRFSRLKPLQIDELLIPNCIDELPIFSVLFAYTDGKSTFRGAKELRFKESDRIAAIANMLKAMKVNFTEFEDGLEIVGNRNHTFGSTDFQSYHDHRIAMASAIASLRARSQCNVIDGECAAISYPEFWSDLDKLNLYKS